MIKYILKRLIYGFVVLILVVTIISSIIYLSPVDPARLTFGQRTDVESVEAKRRELGLDKPLFQQLLAYLSDVSPIGVYNDIDTINYIVNTKESIKDSILFDIVADSANTTLYTVNRRVAIEQVDSLRQVLAQEFTAPPSDADTSLIMQQLVVINIQKPIQKAQFIVLNNLEKYKYQKLIPLGGSSHLVIKAPYLRESFQTGKSVNDILLEAIPKTALLAFVAILLAAILGILLGVFASLRQNSWFDNFAVITSVMGYSLPSYVTALILAYVFGYLLSDYTGLNVQGSLVEINDYGDEVFAWKNLILPAIALGVRPVALVTQLMRSSMLEVLSQDYIRTAKAKGLSYWVVVFKHALRNALNPVVTAISGWFAALLAGAFFVENVFNYDGLGFETVQALLNFDLPVVLGAVLFSAGIFVVMNILIDVLYGILDPRVAI